VVFAVMTLHKLTAGDGYLYLMRHVAKADTDPTHASDPTQNADQTRAPDATSYYTAEGNPPGVWLGRGAVVLGIAGETVTEDAMRNLFGTGAHPHADQIITAFLAEYARPGMTDRQVRELARAAQRHAQLGRRFAEYKPLPPLKDRVRVRTAVLEAETGRAATVEEVARITSAESRRAAGAVAGFDLVFTPVKSLALLWAIDPRAQVREAIRLAHEEAVTETLAFLETHAAHTRTGTDGVAQVDTTGLVAVAFTHYDSRAGDPNLHTHVAVSNKVQGVDGVWRALDARGLHAMAVTASEHYNTRIQTHVTDRLGLRFEARHVARGKQPVIEVAGIPQPVLEHFSRRRAQLEARYDQLLADYRTAHGRDPDFAASRSIAEQANLDTRRGKKPPRSLAEMRDTWRHDLLTTFGPTALRDLVTATTPSRPAPGNPTAAAPAPDLEAVRVALVPGTSEHARLVDALAHEALAAVESTRSTWTVWNLRGQAERLLRDPDTHTRHRLATASAGQLAGLAEAVTARAAGPGFSLRIDPPALLEEPAALRRADGTSVFVRHGADRYTSARVLDAEQRLLTAATHVPDRPPPAPTAGEVESALEQFQTQRKVELDAGQAGVVTAFATDPRTVVVGLGPAGTGKTTAMRALKHVLDVTRTGRLIPLATSAHAASVLAEELGVATENVHKFLHDHHTANAHAIGLRAGDVVLVDEAGMAGTPNLDALLTLTTQAGARLRLLGDDRQLAAVESGGALRLLAEEAGAVELDVVHRFTDPAEAAATLQLRQGDHQGLAFYQAHGRIRGGSAQDMTDRAYAAWLADVHAGCTSVLATTTTADVTRLAARARADRVAAGQVEPGGAALHDGNQAGVGDWIVTRHNDRRLTTPDRRVWVRNGDAWQVVHRRDDGALTVAHLRHGARLVLPAAYIAAHVELLYATTAHRVQGATVDTAHALVTPEAAREHLYVLATRARTSTHLYVTTHTALPVDEDDRLDRRAWDPAGTDATVILQRILDRESAEISATQAIRQAQDTAASLSTLVPRYLHALTLLTTPHYEQILALNLTEADFAEARADDDYPNLLTALRHAHHAGWQPERALATAVRDAHTHPDATPSGHGDGGVSGRSMTRRIADALRELAKSLDPPPPLYQPDLADLHRYRVLLAERGITLDLPVATALERPELLRVPAFDQPAAARPGTRGVPELTAHTYSQDTARALGPRLAATITRAPAWPALQAVLRRAETTGHHPQTLLGLAAIRTGLDTATDPAAALAHRLAAHLHDHPTPAITGLDAGTTTGKTWAWTHLAWTLKAAENTGLDPADLLPAPAPAPDPDSPGQATRPGSQQGPAQAWLHAQTAARRNQRAHARAEAAQGRAEAAEGAPGNEADNPRPVLPWAPAPVPGTVTGADATYLDQLQQLIADRVGALRDQLTQALTDHTLPTWTGAAGPAPDSAGRRQLWLDAVAVVAAFRDQYTPAVDDPAQPLGPHPEPVPHTDRAHATAHAEAALALTRAFDLAHPTPTSGGGHHGTDPAPGAHGGREAEVLRQVTTAAWTSLTPEQKHAVAARVLARLGGLPTPDHQRLPGQQPDPAGPVQREDQAARPDHDPQRGVLSGLDQAVTHPHATGHLHRALAEAGHLPDQPDDTQPRSGQGGRRNRVQRVRADQLRRTPARQPDPRQTPQRQTQQPQPAPQPGHDYTPQPGRLNPDPGYRHRLLP
jgi:conjugative relaxase-like TrwC/TraI family protein